MTDKFNGDKPPYKVYNYPIIDKILEQLYTVLYTILILYAYLFMVESIGDSAAFIVMLIFFTIDAMRKETIYSHSDMGLGPNRLETFQENLAYGLRNASLYWMTSTVMRMIAGFSQ